MEATPQKYTIKTRQINSGFGTSAAHYDLAKKSGGNSTELSFSKNEISFIKGDWDDEVKIYKLVSKRISIREYNTEKSNTEHYMKIIRNKISSLPSSI